jgi:hypothetical protein
MMHKIILQNPFTTPVEPTLFASSVLTLWGYKAGVVTIAQPTSFRMIPHCSSTSFPMIEKKEKIEKQI